MASRELDLDFEFSNDELANFLESFADKIREGEVGLSFKGKEEVRIEPNQENTLSMEFEEGDEYRELEIEFVLKEERAVSKDADGRKKISVEIV
ncbi:amphi-Trp domain-containing protein [Candidatus Nanohaloarchaea archaeon]|nr:amphi-Trp domain-containing protein [Candidatus Nanohaloarchaea archaeon]